MTTPENPRFIKNPKVYQVEHSAAGSAKRSLK
jgi:hypothetical protein